MHMWTEIDNRERTIRVRGRDVTASVEISVREEDESPEGDFDFGDAEEIADELARFRSVELTLLCSRVVSTALDEGGSDYLGMCHVRAGDDDVLSTVRDHRMVENACDELKAAIEQRADALAPFAASEV